LGVVGFLRYGDTTRRLLSALEACKRNIELHVFGDGPELGLYRNFAADKSNVFLHGPFRNPHDLARIYENIDLNLVLYDSRDVNVQWAIPNKLYESVFFGVPLLVSAGTELAQRVQQWGVGRSVDSSSAETIGCFIDTVSFRDLAEQASKSLAIPASRLCDDSDGFCDRILAVSTKHE
jgi:glycosyltransferase involved in cell wall biosynthesis